MIDDKNFSIKNFDSFSSAIFSIFISVSSKLPTLASHLPGSLKNTSKYEIAFVTGLNNFHNDRFEHHEIFSFINQNGHQFRIRNFTADWYCKQCKIAIFIEGNFKYICPRHDKKTNYIGRLDQKRKQLHKNGQKKRKLFQKLGKDDVKKIFVIGQCCIDKKDYPRMFINSILYHPKLEDTVKNEIRDAIQIQSFFPFRYKNCF